jgi:hypothetical protein
MTDQPHAELLQHAPAAKKDLAAADQMFGALEALFEKVPDDKVVAAFMPECRKFRILMRELVRELDALAAAADGEPVETRPSKARALIGEWEETRQPFRQESARHQDYLEKLALRIYR